MEWCNKHDWQEAGSVRLCLSFVVCPGLILYSCLFCTYILWYAIIK